MHTGLPKLSPRAWHRLRLCAAVLLLLLGGDLLLIAIKWPFTRNRTIASMERVSGCDVTTARFHGKFFPSAGYVAEHVIFARRGTVLATIQKIDCRASWIALLSMTHTLRCLELTGLAVTIPAPVPPPVKKHETAEIPTTVDDLFAPGTVLQIAPRQGSGPPARFDFPRLHVSSLARNKAAQVDTALLNEKLIGIVEVNASVGPFDLKQVKRTRLAGNYRLHGLNLSSFKYLEGELSAFGHFSGSLGAAMLQGQLAIPDFEVSTSRHAQGVSADFHAMVDGTSGNVSITSATVHFIKTTLIARGQIARENGKTITAIDINSNQARVEDVLYMFAESTPAVLDGALTMDARVILPSGDQPFLKRLQLKGDFEIAAGCFTNTGTEQKVQQLSSRARGKKDAATRQRVWSQMGSHTTIANGIATLSNAYFTVPGAVVRGSGTYNLRNQAVDLKGELAMRATLSKATKGVKSLLLVPLDPFFRKRGAGAIIPVRITGTYSKPIFKTAL